MTFGRKFASPPPPLIWLLRADILLFFKSAGTDLLRNRSIGGLTYNGKTSRIGNEPPTGYCHLKISFQPRFWPGLAVAAILLFVVLMLFPSFWPYLLAVDIPMEHADAIVVLGGEAKGRPREAARLFHAGVAPLVFVVGIGDAERGRQTLLSEGVPSNKIVLEQQSRSTIQNADFSGALMRDAGVKRALLVTSQFHTRRALATFRKRVPEIEFGVTGTRIPCWDTPKGKKDEGRFALVETAKILFYSLAYGISPFVDLKSPTDADRQP